MLVNVYQNLQEDYNNSDIDESVKELIQILTPIEEMSISELLCYCEQAQRRVDSIFEAERFYNQKIQASIIRCCRNTQKTAGLLNDGTKLTWMYYIDYLKDDNI